MKDLFTILRERLLESVIQFLQDAFNLELENELDLHSGNL